MFDFPIYNTGTEDGRHYSRSFVVYGKNKHRDLSAYCKEDTFLILLIDSKIESFECGVTFDLQVKVSAEPDVAEVSRIIALLPKTRCTVVGVGGGATMDLAKAIVCARHYPKDGRIGYGISGNLASRIEDAKDFLILLPTTVGSGSEASRYFVLFMDGKKLANRAWQALPRLIVIDPALVSYLTPKTARIQLFDCWSHLTEVTLSHLELSPFNLFQVSNAKDSLMSLVKSDEDFKTDRQLLQLQVYSFIGGGAISNTRTGALHTVGEALASQIKMPHVWSLYFSAINWGQLTIGPYRSNPSATTINSSMQITMAQNDLDYWLPFLKDNSQESLVLDKKEIGEFDLGLFIKSVLSDKVLWEKEHPVVLTTKQISDYLAYTYEEVQKFSNV